MHQPERWPLSQAEDWWAWRDHLDHVHDPNIVTLKREADCEIARILRCCESRRSGAGRAWCRQRPRETGGNVGEREESASKLLRVPIGVRSNTPAAPGLPRSSASGGAL